MWWERLQVRDFSVAFIFRLQWRFSTSGGVFNFIAGLPTSGRRLAKDNSSSFLGHNSTARHEDLVEVCQPVSQERTACLVSQDVDYAARHQPQIASQWPSTRNQPASYFQLHQAHVGRWWQGKTYHGYPTFNILPIRRYKGVVDICGWFCYTNYTLFVISNILYL